MGRVGRLAGSRGAGASTARGELRVVLPLAARRSAESRSCEVLQAHPPAPSSRHRHAGGSPRNYF